MVLDTKNSGNKTDRQRQIYRDRCEQRKPTVVQRSFKTVTPLYTKKYYWNQCLNKVTWEKTQWRQSMNSLIPTELMWFHGLTSVAYIFETFEIFHLCLDGEGNGFKIGTRPRDFSSACHLSFDLLFLHTKKHIGSYGLIYNLSSLCGFISEHICIQEHEMCGFETICWLTFKQLLLVFNLVKVIPYLFLSRL